MKKRHASTNQHQIYHAMQESSYGIDQNYRRGHNNNVADLVTHKEKMIEKKNKINVHNRYRDDSDQGMNDRVFEFQEQLENNRNRILQRKMEKQLNEKLLQKINFLMSKNKINSKTAFDVPILQVKGFVLDEDWQEGDIAWSKVSSIVENDYKIYGFRADLIGEEFGHFCNKFERSALQQVAQKDKQHAKVQKQQKITKLSDLMSTEAKNNLMLHLEKNSELLDINLRRKLMMRKDPLFQRTSRKFDHSSYSSFFMNTLSFSKGLYMQINGEADSVKINSQIKENSQMVDENNVRDEPDLENIEIMNEGHRQLIRNAFTGENIRSFSFPNLMENYRANLEIVGTKFFPDSFQWAQQSKTFEKIMNMIQKGQLKSAFEYGQFFSYDDIKNQSQHESDMEDEDNRFHKVECRIFHDEEAQNRKRKPVQIAKPIQEQSPVQVKIEAAHLEIQNNQEPAQNVQANSPVNNPQNLNDQIMNQPPISEIVIDQISPIMVPLPQKMEKKARKIKQVIKIREPQQKNTLKGTRPKRTPKQPKDPLKTLTKTRNVIPLEEREKVEKSMFSSSSKLVPQKILKKQKIANRDIDFQNIVERNLIQSSINCNYQTKYMIQLRPIPTKQELKIERKRLKLHLEQEKDRKMQAENNQNHNQQPEEIINQLQQAPLQQTNLNQVLIDISSQQDISQNTPQIPLKNQTISTVKQNIYSIVKSARSITFKNLHNEYCRLHGNISPATIFIGMLHLTNERFIKSVQQNMKDFNISIL